MRLSSVNLLAGYFPVAIQTANPADLGALIEAGRLEALAAFPDARLAQVVATGAGDGPQWVVVMNTGAAAAVPDGVPLDDLRFVVGYGSNLQALGATAGPLFEQALADGYTLLVGSAVAGSSSGLRVIAIAVLQRPSP